MSSLADVLADVLGALKGYRTLIVNTIVLVGSMLVGFGVLHVVAPTPDAVGSNFDSVYGWLLSAVAAVNMILRLFTTTPVTTTDAPPSTP